MARDDVDHGVTVDPSAPTVLRLGGWGSPDNPRYIRFRIDELNDHVAAGRISEERAAILRARFEAGEDPDYDLDATEATRASVEKRQQVILGAARDIIRNPAKFRAGNAEMRRLVDRVRVADRRAWKAAASRGRNTRSERRCEARREPRSQSRRRARAPSRDGPSRSAAGDGDPELARSRSRGRA